MTWQRALERVVADSGHGRYRELCAEARPDHELWRRRVVELAAAGEYPGPLARARNLVGSLWRWALSGFRLARPIVVARRKAICRGNSCGVYDTAQDRCRACGCKVSLKPYLNSEECPRGHW